MLSLNKMMGFALAIAAFFLLVLAFVSPGSGLFPKTAKTTIDALDFDMGIGLEENLAEEVGISKIHKKELGSLQYTIDLLKESTATNERKNIFDHWGGFSSLEGEMKVFMTQKDNNVEVRIDGGAGGKQLYDKFTIEGMKLCVIAGNKEITKNFDYNFLTNTATTLREPYYNLVNKIEISFNTKGKNQNRIDFGSGPVNFEGDEWLFTPTHQVICFFPTVNGDLDCDGNNVKGLDNDCFLDNDEKDAIPYKILNGYLNTAGSEAKLPGAKNEQEKIVREKVTP